MVVNGETYDWNSLTCNVEGMGTALVLTEVAWSDGQEGGPVYGKGGLPAGRFVGNYALEGSLKMDRRQYDEWEKRLKNLGTTIYRQRPFTIIAEYANPDQPISRDELPECKVTAVKQSIAQKAEMAEVEVTWKSSGVRIYNGQPVA